MKKVFVIFLVVLLFLTGCSSNQQTEKTTTPATQPATSEKPDANDIYEKIQTGMTIEQVQSLIGKKPISQSESSTDTPAGKIEIKELSWQIGKAVITVIFENGKVTAKNKTGF